MAIPRFSLAGEHGEYATEDASCPMEMCVPIDPILPSLGLHNIIPPSLIKNLLVHPPKCTHSIKIKYWVYPTYGSHQEKWDFSLIAMP